MLDTHRPKTPAMLEAFGRFIGLRGLTIAVQGLGSAAAESILAEIHRIPARLTEIFARSSATLRPTSELADEMARQLIAEAR